MEGLVEESEGRTVVAALTDPPLSQPGGIRKEVWSVLLPTLMLRLNVTRQNTKQKLTNVAWRRGSGGSSSQFSACPAFWHSARFGSPVQMLVCKNRGDGRKKKIQNLKQRHYFALRSSG